MADIGTMQEQLQALEAQLGSSVSMVAAFDGELARMRETMIFTGREVNTLSGGISGGLRKAFDGLVFDGMKLNDALKSVAKTIVDTVYSIAMQPVTGALGGLLAQGIGIGDGRGDALCGGRRLQPGQGDALCQGRHRVWPDELSDAGRARADGRGRAGGDHAAGARPGRAAGCAVGRRAGRSTW